MAFGLVDTQHIDFYEGADEDTIRSMQNRLGIDWVEFIRRVDGAMAALNQGDSLMRMLTYDTTEQKLTQPGPSDKVWMRSAEYFPGRVQRTGPGRSWQLPMYFYEIDLGFTDRALKVIRLEQFQTELRTTVQAIARGRRADVLQRLFDDAEVPLDDEGTGASPGFAGSGTSTNVFVGTLPNGAQTDANYTHYFQSADDGAALDTTIKLMQANMELWDPGPFDLIGSPDAIDRITSNQDDDTQFVSAGSTLIRPGERESEALVDAGRYLGVYNGRIRVMKPEYQIAEGPSDTHHFALVRSYGDGNSNNPLAWRYDPIFGREAYVDDRALTPLSQAMIMQTYGVGVANRTAATLCSIGGDEGEYEAPSINR